MFLFGGGVAYGLATRRPNAAGGSGARHVRRGLLLLALGYLLQLPRAPLAEIAARPDLLAVAAGVGPLQLVGSCLLLCEAVRHAARTRPARSGALLAALLATVVCAPWMWQARLTSRTLWLGSWLDGHAGSPFPFFPWAAFFLLGVVISAPIASAVARPIATRQARLRLGLCLIGWGLAATAFAYALFVRGYLLRNLYGAHEFWHTSPLFVVFRAGLVVAWIGALSVAEPALASWSARAPGVSRVLGALSKQSLVAYVTHLLLLYGSIFTPGLKQLGKLDLAAAGGVFAGVLTFTSAVAVLWESGVTAGTTCAVLRAAASRLGGVRRREVDRVPERERRDSGRASSV
jgi:hypothetical protein